MILTLKYINFWKTDELSLWFYNFLKIIFQKKYDIQLTESNNCDICICSVFGSFKNIHKINAKLKIFFYGENLSFIRRKKEYNNINKLKNNFNLIIGFLPTDLNNKIIRFPLWLIFYPFYQMTKDNNNIIDYIKNQRKLNLKEKKIYFSSCIANHSKLGIRRKICNNFSNYGKIIYPGKFRKNFNIGPSWDDKIKFLKNIKFNICPENSKSLGYCTEKIFHALEAGCLPVYWGNDFPEKNIINEKCYSFINIDNEDKMKKDIKNSIDNYNEIIKEEIFKEEAKDIVKNYYDTLKKEIMKFF